MKTVKKETRVSAELAEWLQGHANKSGASQSAILALALSEMRERKGRAAFLQEQA